MLGASLVRALPRLWRRFGFEPGSASSIYLFRVVFGSLTLVWFGAQGAAPSDATYVRLLYAQMVASCCLIVGLQSRLSLFGLDRLGCWLRGRR